MCMYAYVYILSLSHTQVSKSLKILLVNANIIQLVTLTLQFPDYRYENKVNRKDIPSIYAVHFKLLSCLDSWMPLKSMTTAFIITKLMTVLPVFFLSKTLCK